MNGPWISSGVASSIVITGSLLAVVVGMACWAFVGAHQATERLAQEFRALARLREHGRGMEDPGGREAARDRLRAHASGKVAAAAGPVTHAVLEIMLRSAARGDLPSRDGIAAVAEARIDRWLRPPRTITHVLVLVGLSCTLLGLTMSVMGLSAMGPVPSHAEPTVASDGRSGAIPVPAQPMADAREKIDQLFAAIEETLVGIRTAFVPALGAVVLTIALLFRMASLQARQREWLAELEEVADTVLYPALDPGPDRALAQGAAAAVQAADQLLEAALASAQTLRTASSEASDAYRTVLDGAGKNLAASIAAAATVASKAVGEVKAAAERAGEAMRRAAEETGKRLESAAAADREPLRAAAQEARLSLLPVVQALDERTTRFLAALDQADVTSGQVSRALECGAAMVAQATAAQLAMQEGLKMMAARVERETEGHEHLAAGTTRLAAALEDIERTRRTLSEMHASQQQWARAALEQLQEQVRLSGDAANRAQAITASTVRESELSAPSDAEPMARRIHVVDPGRQMEELARLITALLHEQRDENDARWRQVMEEQAERWAAEQAAARATLAEMVRAASAGLSTGPGANVGGTGTRRWWETEIRSRRDGGKPVR
ncbi:MAG: hypothetical protein JWM27_2424 [Gemmatimonadetes bacterium]|nr:hypothetical protein [Gemmatimonadota bacterium]